jgi:RNA polymerase sigma-70 factor, ECF subfamily
MLGSVHDADDALQETFLRAWKALPRFEGRSAPSSWLYRISTNVCLDAIARRPKRVLPVDYGPPAVPGADPGEPLDASVWVEPYPDEQLGVEDGYAGPEARYEQREAVELAFIAALQHLPARQRATLILREVLGFSAREAADSLETTVASVNSALQRARGTLRQHLPARRLEWAPHADPSEQERQVVQRFMEAMERTDAAAVAELLREDVIANMPPYPFWFQGRDANIRAMSMAFDPESPYYVGQWRCVPTGANMQPAVAFYVQRPGDSEFRAFAIDVLRIEDGQVAELTAFPQELFAAFGLPPKL